MEPTEISFKDIDYCGLKATYLCDLDCLSFSYEDEELLRDVVSDVLYQYLKAESILNEKGKSIKESLSRIKDEINRHLASRCNKENNI